MPGRKTHEQQVRMFERKDDLPREDDAEAASGASTRQPSHPEARHSEMAVSQGGMNQESRHNKHNDPERGA